jgi:hypothetical protein
MEGMWRGAVCTGIGIMSLLVGGCGAAGSTTGTDLADAARPPAGSLATSPPAAHSGIDVGAEVDPSGGVGLADEQRGPAFPMTVRRSGGIADYADRVVVQANGRVTVDTRTVTGRTCTLAPAQRSQLLKALTALRAVAPVASDASTGASTDTTTDTATDGDAAPSADTPAGDTTSRTSASGESGEPGGSGDSGEAGDAGPITLSLTDHLLRTFDLTDSSLAGLTDLLGSVVTNVTLTQPAGATCTTPATSPTVPVPMPVGSPSAATDITAAG